MTQLEALGLSPAEIRVALLIAQGKNAKEAGRILGVSHETVRTQLGSIFGKTGARRQSALAVLVVRMERN